MRPGTGMKLWQGETSRYRQIIVVIILGVGVQAVEGTVTSQNDVEVDGRHSSNIPVFRISHLVNPPPLAVLLSCFTTSVPVPLSAART